MPFWKPSDRVRLASLEEGTKFLLCRNGLRYKLIDKSYSKGRARVKTIGHASGVASFSRKTLPTLNKNCLVVPISESVNKELAPCHY
ncbi:hypothetical protein ACXHQB_23805 [Vibrio parahaemolyticus]|uniref:hypothetical protein n=1 Tax=Vibrio parahaemolyticus TaxID=670 RepID=UPI001D164A39|nr:hypothetical protein [Vibrio parahaemolyticus]MCC3798242.1 hypothetical protein [Vibrio parahaemolyticus]